MKIATVAKRLWSSRVFRIAAILLITSAVLLVSYEGVNAAGAAYFIKKGGKVLEEGNYQEALSLFQKADSFWDRTLVFSRVRISPTDWRVSLAERWVASLAESRDNYTAGVEAFEVKEWGDSAKFLSKVLPIDIDPDYQDAQEKLTLAKKKLNEIAATEAEKKSSSSATTQNQTSSNTQPPPAPTYNDLHCPNVVKMQDSLGNSGEGGYLKGTFKRGSISSLTLTVTAIDPQNLTLYYHFSDTWGGGINSDWTASNTYTFDVTDAPVGANRWISVMVDNQDGYGCSGAYYDINASFYYDITP